MLCKSRPSLQEFILMVTSLCHLFQHLNLLLACCSKAPPPGDALLLQLFSSLPALPSVPLLRYTACMTVASYSSWLHDTTSLASASQLMPQLLQMLTTGESVFTMMCIGVRQPQSCAGVYMAAQCDTLLPCRVGCTLICCRFDRFP